MTDLYRYYVLRRVRCLIPCMLARTPRNADISLPGSLHNQCRKPENAHYVYGTHSWLYKPRVMSKLIHYAMASACCLLLVAEPLLLRAE